MEPNMKIRSLSLCLTMCCVGIAGARADTIVVNANGYTFTGEQLTRFQAMGFSDAGKVVAVGSTADVRAKMPQAKQIDLGGKTMLPGLIDAHGHVLALGVVASAANLRSSRTLAEAQKIIADYARTFPQLSWVRGSGWNQEIWQLGRFPTAQELDAAVNDRPVWMSRVDGHAGWANTRALAAAGITKTTPDPQGGRIEHNADGTPSGVLVDAAMDLMEKILPARTEAEARLDLNAALDEMASWGLTSVHDAGVDAGTDRLYREYAMAGKLKTRIYGMISGSDALFKQVSSVPPLNSFANDLYALRSVKLYADGALGSRGAALLAPYSDAPTKGLLFNANAAIYAQMQTAISHGYQVNVHAIGDAGNRQILDGFAKLLTTPAAHALRNRIEHAQVVALTDIPRFKKLDIIPSMQPTHATSDMNMAENRVGHERIKGAYAWRSFLHQGSKIACGSDFPVESANPFLGIYAAVTRQDADHAPAGGWYPNQAMSLTEALRCFTVDAAYAAHQEKMLGSLEPGKWADFIVTDADLFRMPTYDIQNMKVLQTWVAGKQVFAR
jgi:hypothetical protein